jgi:hypothetical protein
MIILPSLHIILGLFKNFVKAVGKNVTGFHYLKEKFPPVSHSKINEVMLLGPKIKALIRDEKFVDLLSQIEKSACKPFKSLVKFFLGNRNPTSTVKLWVNVYSHTKIWGVICLSRYISRILT